MMDWKRKTSHSWASDDAAISAARVEGDLLYSVWVRDETVKCHPKGWRCIGSRRTPGEARLLAEQEVIARNN